MCYRQRSATHHLRVCHRRQDFTRVCLAGWCSGFSAARGTHLSASLRQSPAHRLVTREHDGRRPARFGALAACTALLTATIAFLAWLARAGSIVNFVSETVLIGFKAGVALQLASTQLPKLFGVTGGHGNFWERMDVFFRHVDETNSSSLLLGCAALGLLILGKKLLPNKPVALFVVIGGIAAASLVDFGAHGVKLLGEVPRGLPMPSLPAVHWDDLGDLLPLALACFLLGAVETAASANVCREARLSSRQQPGIPCPCSREFCLRPWPWLSSQRRHVAVARK